MTKKKTNYNNSSHSPLLTSTGPKNTFLMFVYPLNVLIFSVFVYVMWGVVRIYEAQNFVFFLQSGVYDLLFTV